MIKLEYLLPEDYINIICFLQPFSVTKCNAKV